MKQFTLITLSIALFTFSHSAYSGGVAVLDIDAVARELGVEEKVRVDLLDQQNRLNSELKTMQEQLQEQMTGVEKAAGEDPTEEQRRQIMATNQQLNAEFNRMKAQAQQSLAQERVRMINEFRNKLEPLALMVAKENGMDVVLMKVTPPVFAFTSDVDITNATTKKAEEAGMRVEVPKETSPPVAEPTGGISPESTEESE